MRLTRFASLVRVTLAGAGAAGWLLNKESTPCWPEYLLHLEIEHSDQPRAHSQAASLYRYCANVREYKVDRGEHL